MIIKMKPMNRTIADDKKNYAIETCGGEKI
jgi:hypothetical protein